ncbi:hypothetical protein KC19_1G285100 [Ceratodon purpureus]|uniref:Uncharacterized protein n=1 Tax=Ceratodon purpureus TaxID=3225 RepID=A0A8T0JAD3_CERPU|nr:hypothetical protein KC19_1G285100 [Ceratodon purpureus]
MELIKWISFLLFISLSLSFLNAALPTTKQAFPFCKEYPCCVHTAQPIAEVLYCP